MSERPTIYVRRENTSLLYSQNMYTYSTKHNNIGEYRINRELIALVYYNICIIAADRIPLFLPLIAPLYVRN